MQEIAVSSEKPLQLDLEAIDNPDADLKRSCVVLKSHADFLEAWQTVNTFTNLQTL